METSTPSENVLPLEDQEPKDSKLKKLFQSPEERRLRAGWRIFIQGILYQALYFLFFLPFIFLVRGFLSFTILLDKSISLVAVLLAVFFARRYLDRRSFLSLGLNLKWLSVRDLLVGFTFAGLIMGLIYFLEWSAGWLQFTGFTWQSLPPQRIIKNALSAILLFSIVAFDEELLSRGYHLQNLSDGARTRIERPGSTTGFGSKTLTSLITLFNLFAGKKSLLWGSLASSVIFAILHLANPFASFNAFLGLLAAGLFLSYAYVRTRQLWLPIGLHIGWNFFEGTVFGFPVSGIDLQGLVGQINNGPAIITGGRFGPEAGMVLLPGLALGFILVHYYTR
jgi:membrane protease YdiL (CAAX protease family)